MTPVSSSSPTRSRTLASDAWGGLAAMLVALPSAIAYGVAAFTVLGPDYVATGVRAGLIGAVVIGFVSAVIGGAPRLISAPSAPAAAVLASLAAQLGNGDTGAVSSTAILIRLGAIALLAGLLQVLYGVLGGGRLIKFIPFPVVTGYLSAVALLIFVSQLPKLLGIATSASFLSLLTSPDAWRWPALLVGAVTIATMILAARLTKVVPAAILALLAGCATYFVLALFWPELWRVTGNTFVLGPMVSTGAGVNWTEVTSAIARLGPADYRALVVPALTLSVLLSVDTLKTCVIVDAIATTRHDSNRVLLGQGVANTASALLGGMPGSGTIGATLVNLESGGTTRASAVFASGFVLVASLVLGRWIAWVPLSALAGVLVVVAARMFDWSSLQLLRQRSTWLDFLVIATVIVVAITTNLVAAAGAGVALAIVLFLRDQIRGSVIRHKIPGNRISSKQHRLPAEQAVLEQHGAQTIVCELQGNLFFGTTDQLFRELEFDLQTCRFLILDLRRVQSLDYTATHLFAQFETMLAERNGCLLFSRLPARRELRAYFSAFDTVGHRRHARTFDTLDDALQWAEDQVLAEHICPAGANQPPLELGAFELTREFDPTTLAALSECAVVRSIDAGQSIFKAGDDSDELFLVRKGIARVVLPLKENDYHTLATFGRGHFFGEMAFLVRGTRSATAVATTMVEVFVISRRRFDDASRANPILGVKIFARLARMLAIRLRRTDAELRALYDN